MVFEKKKKIYIYIYLLIFLKLTDKYIKHYLTSHFKLTALIIVKRKSAPFKNQELLVDESAINCFIVSSAAEPLENNYIAVFQRYFLDVKSRWRAVAEPWPVMDVVAEGSATVLSHCAWRLTSYCAPIVARVTVRICARPAILFGQCTHVCKSEVLIVLLPF